jgi:hypothetical protein
MILYLPRVGPAMRNKEVTKTRRRNSQNPKPKKQNLRSPEASVRGQAGQIPISIVANCITVSKKIRRQIAFSTIHEQAATTRSLEIEFAAKLGASKRGGVRRVGAENP